MYRSVILDFLSMNRTQLNKFKFKQATISLLGRFNQKDISSLLLRADEIITYHVNEPRIYEKIYSFETFSQTICDMVVFTKQQIYLTKEQLTTINDPFYLKDIKLIDFNSIVLIPIIKNEDVLGTIIFYFDDFAKDFKCKQSDLLKLFNNLQEYQSNLYESQISNLLLDNEEFIKVVYPKNQSKCYIDNILKHKFHLKSNIIDLNEKSLSKRIEKEINSKKYHYVSNDIFDIYYINKYDYQQNNENFSLKSF